MKTRKEILQLNKHLHKQGQHYCSRCDKIKTYKDFYSKELYLVRTTTLRIIPKPHGYCKECCRKLNIHANPSNCMHALERKLNWKYELSKNNVEFETHLLNNPYVQHTVSRNAVKFIVTFSYDL